MGFSAGQTKRPASKGRCVVWSPSIDPGQTKFNRPHRKAPHMLWRSSPHRPLPMTVDDLDVLPSHLDASTSLAVWAPASSDEPPRPPSAVRHDMQHRKNARRAALLVAACIGQNQVTRRLPRFSPHVPQSCLPEGGQIWGQIWRALFQNLAGIEQAWPMASSGRMCRIDFAPTASTLLKVSAPRPISESPEG